jgi:hypothetical protein
MILDYGIEKPTLLGGIRVVVRRNWRNLIVPLS